MFFNFGQTFKTVFAWHIQVKEKYIRNICGNPFQMVHKLFAIMHHCERSSKSKFFNRIFEEQAIILVIIGKENIHGSCTVHFLEAYLDKSYLQVRINV